MLPQGMFSVAVATVLFPALSRLVARQDWDGLRALAGQRHPPDRAAADPRGGGHDRAAGADHAARLPARRVRRQSTEQVAEALFWFSFSLPFSGFNLLLTRTFFSLQRPWTPTALAGVTLAINIAVCAALYEPLGIGGVVLGTVVATAAMTAGQAFYLRRRIGGLQLAHDGAGDDEDPRRRRGPRRRGLRHLVRPRRRARRSLLAQIVSVGGAIALGSAVYAALVLAMRIPEARQILELFTRRLRRS